MTARRWEGQCDAGATEDNINSVACDVKPATTKRRLLIKTQITYVIVQRICFDFTFYRYML